MATLESTRRELVVLREVARLHEAAGHPGDPSATAEIARTTMRIAELETLIIERRAIDSTAPRDSPEE